MPEWLTALKWIAFSVNFCVFVVNVRLLCVKCIEIKFTHILDERRLTIREALMIEREKWRSLEQ